jgi:regulator of replication initiation timing
MSTKMIRRFELWRSVMLAGLMAWTVPSSAQQATNQAASPPPSSDTASLNDSIRELREQVRELQAAVADMRSDWQRAHSETVELRRELDQIRTPEVHVGAETQTAAQNGMPQDAKQGEENQKKIDHAASLDEQYQLLAGKVDDQYQTKVESAAKYRLRISGIVLMNAFSNQGIVDSVDLPTLAYARPPGSSGGSFGATLRQSEIGFETFGPDVAGAKTKADLQLDLAGGFPAVPNGVTSGLVRLRTATMRMDWTDTSVVVGQDGIFFSPNSPTSFASLAIPALTYAGNLWSWVPQIRVEHRVALGDEAHLILQAGILDPLTGETPSSSYYQQPGPGESSRQPAYGARIAWTRNVFGQPLQLGVGGYYSRQNYGFNRNVDGWAGMTDIELPLSHQFTLSGKFYRGRALGGLYGGIGRSVLFSGDPALANTQVQALDSIGGWAQLKYRPVNKWEFNAAFGMDNPYASDLKYFSYPESYGDPTLARNQGSFVNMIYRPRSDLLFSAEYRHITTYSLTDGGNNAGQLNLMMGVLF